MKRTFKSSIVAALAVTALAGSGCEKKEDKAATPGATGAAPATPAPGAASAPGGATAAVPSGTGFAVFPADSQLLVGINVGALRSSALWAQNKDKLEQGLPPEFAELRAACGLDPLAQLETVIFAGRPQQEEGVMVVKGLQRSAIKGCGEKMAASKGKKLAIADEGNLTSYTTDGETVWGAWIDDKTMVVAPKKDKAYVQQRAAGTGGITDASPLMSLLKSVDTGASIYMVADLSTFGALPVAGAKGAFASLKLTDGLAIDAGGRFDTADNAKGAHTMATAAIAQAKGQLPPNLGKLVDKAIIKQVDNDVVLQLQLTGPELAELTQMLQGMAGMMGGKMGGGL